MTLDGAIKGTDRRLLADQRQGPTCARFAGFASHFDAVLHGARTLGMGLDRYLWSDELQEHAAAALASDRASRCS